MEQRVDGEQLLAVQPGLRDDREERDVGVGTGRCDGSQDRICVKELRDENGKARSGETRVWRRAKDLVARRPRGLRGL